MGMAAGLTSPIQVIVPPVEIWENLLRCWPAATTAAGSHGPAGVTGPNGVMYPGSHDRFYFQ